FRSIGDRINADTANRYAFFERDGDFIANVAQPGHTVFAFGSRFGDEDRSLVPAIGFAQYVAQRAVPGLALPDGFSTQVPLIVSVEIDAHHIQQFGLPAQFRHHAAADHVPALILRDAHF